MQQLNIQMNTTELDRVMKDIDADGKGSISYIEFVQRYDAAIKRLNLGAEDPGLPGLGRQLSSRTQAEVVQHIKELLRGKRPMDVFKIVSDPQTR
jgi:hypothetical protein